MDFFIVLQTTLDSPLCTDVHAIQWWSREVIMIAPWIEVESKLDPKGLHDADL